MSDLAIKAEGLGKLYWIGEQREDTLRNALGEIVRDPRKIFKRRKKEKFWALKDASLEIKHGEVLGLIGRNGAGKTTLLKILSRITRPTKGWAEIYGRVGSLLEVGTGFHPDLSGRDNIYLSGAMLGMGKREIRSKFDEIVAFAELEKFIGMQVKHYSSGMYVRLAFAVAAHLDPEILLVDEVLAVGDLSFQKKCLGKMGEVSRGGRTVLFVSHNMAAVENLCSRAVVLHQGRLCFDGSSKDAIQFYLNSLSTQSGTGHVVELSGVGDRRSIIAPLLRRLEFLTDNEQQLTEGLPIGSRLKVKVYFDLPKSTSNFNVGLGFNNTYGQRIFTAHSVFEPNRSEKEHEGATVFSC